MFGAFRKALRRRSSTAMKPSAPRGRTAADRSLHTLKLCCEYCRHSEWVSPCGHRTCAHTTLTSSSMTRVALIGLALAAALPAAGCTGTMAALREGRSAQTTKQVQQPQVDAIRWMKWTPLAGLRPLFRLPHPVNTVNAITVQFDPTPDAQHAGHPVQRSATRSKIPAQLAVLVAQSGTASRSPMPRRQSASGLPAKIPEQSPRLSQARTTAPIVPQARPAPPTPPVGPLARPPAVAEPPRQQADPSAEEPTVTGSNPALAGSRTTASVEAQKTPSMSPLRQPEPKGSLLY